jgi:tRNA G26 N,N-dimethylase Trm1
MTEATDKLLKDFDKALADYPLLMTKNQTAGVLNVSVASINRLLAVGQLERVGFQMSATKMESVRIPKPSVRKLIVSWVTEETT